MTMMPIAHMAYKEKSSETNQIMSVILMLNVTSKLSQTKVF